MLPDPTAFLDAIHDDGPPVYDEDDDSFEPWEADRQEVVAELACELGPFEWNRVMDLADRGQIDPYVVLRHVRSTRMSPRSLCPVGRQPRRREQRPRSRGRRSSRRSRAPARPRQTEDDLPDAPEAA